MGTKVAENDFTRKMIHFDTLQKLPKNVGDLGQLKTCPKSNKSPNLVTLAVNVNSLLYIQLTLGMK